MAGIRLKAILAFLGLWFVFLVYFFSRSQVGDSVSELEELTRQLRHAKDSISSLVNKNKALEHAAADIRRSMDNRVGEKIEQVNKEVEEAKGRLNAAALSDEECEKKISDLEVRIAELRNLQEQGHEYVAGGKHGIIDTPGSGPSLEHELARFKLEDNIRELWFFTKSQLSKLQTPDSRRILEDIGHRHRSIQVDLYTLSQADNNEAWREKEHAELQDLMQRRLHFLQNPKDCSKAKKLVCDLNKSCGFGCQLHHALYCFMIAYGTERTMIMNSVGWRYNAKGWQEVFLPMSETCTKLSAGEVPQPWNGETQTQNVKVVSMPIVDALHNRPPYMPLSFPEDLAPRLRTLHGDPSVWFVSQFVKYMMRMQPSTEQDLESVKAKLGFKNPIVGVHVRRTDKVGTEAAFHGIDEYMEHVNEWFLAQERIPGRVDKRRVYIASDDPKVLPEARQKYPDYEFFGDVAIAQSAGVGSRYSGSSLRGVIIDIELLSMTNYLVCTFSSQVCRVAYEIMQTRYPDPSAFFHSLDDIYYFGGQGAHEETALYPHDPANRNEIALAPGDVVGIAGNHWDGYSKGQNRRTGGIGLYPSYKTEDRNVIVKYPIYPEVPLAET